MSIDGVDQFVFDNVPRRSRLDSAIIEYAALQRGYGVIRARRFILMLKVAGDALSFQGLNGPDVSQVARLNCNYRDLHRKLLAGHGIPVPEHAVFAGIQSTAGQRYAGELGGSVRVLPARLSGVKGVTPGVRSEAAFGRAWRRAVAAYGAKGASRPVLVEKLPAGEHHRFFVVDDDVVAVSRMVPANVVGDGTSNVKELIEQKNAVRALNPLLRDYKIVAKADSLRGLTRSGYTLRDVPGVNETVTLRYRTSLSSGIDVVDVTDQVDSRLKQLAIEAVRVMPGLCYGTVDMVVPRVTEPAASPSAGAVVTQVDDASEPLGLFPSHGERRDIAGAILDHYERAPRWKRNQEPHPVALLAGGRGYREPLHLEH